MESPQSRGNVIVRIGDHELDTGFDQFGVQRFLPHGKGNLELRALLKDWEDLLEGGMDMIRSIREDSLYTEENMYADYHRGRWSAEDIFFALTNSGERVDMITEYAIFKHLKVQNPDR